MNKDAELKAMFLKSKDLLYSHSCSPSAFGYCLTEFMKAMKIPSEHIQEVGSFALSMFAFGQTMQSGEWQKEHADQCDKPHQHEPKQPKPTAAF